MTRFGMATEGDWDSASLIGSWFVAVDPEAKVVSQGCVVAEPSGGTYLVEVIKDEDIRYQRLVPIDVMVEDGWAFFDSQEWMQAAFEREQRDAKAAR